MGKQTGDRTKGHRLPASGFAHEPQGLPAAADSFRLDGGKLIENWGVLQAVPETSANDKSMF